MAPSHTLRREAWTLAARLTAALVVCFVLLAAVAVACDEPPNAGATPPAQGPTGGDEGTQPPGDEGTLPPGDQGTEQPADDGATPPDQGLSLIHI